METARTFRDLKVWQNARALTMEIYALTKFYRKEAFKHPPQLGKAAVSVPSNTADGSLAEKNYQLYLVDDLSYGETKSAFQLDRKIRSQFINYIKSIRID